MRRIAILLFALLLSVPTTLLAEDHPPAPKLDFDHLANLNVEPIRALPVQHEGRKKPLDTLAREMVQGICGRSTYRDLDPVVVFLSMVCQRQAWANQPDLMKVRFHALLDLFDQPHKKPYLSPVRIATNETFLVRYEKVREKKRAAQRSTNPEKSQLEPVEKEIWRLASRLHAFDSLPQQFRFVPPATGELDAVARTESGHGRGPGGLAAEGERVYTRTAASWSTIEDGLSTYDEEKSQPVRTAWIGFTMAMHDGKTAEANKALQSFVEATGNLRPEAYPSEGIRNLEVTYNRYNPFSYSWIAYVTAFAALLIAFFSGGRISYVLGLTFYGVGFTGHTAGLIVRWVLAGRAPWSNLFESAVVICWALMAFAILFEIIYRTRIFVTVAALIGFAGMAAAASLPPIYGWNIEPLVPVLRTFWLKYHVISLLLSYGAFTLAFGLGITYLLKLAKSSREGETLAPDEVKEEAEQADPLSLGRIESFIYRSVQVGFVLLTLGTILGAVWANESWGRYWGWDNKETWAFITWLIYASFLHARYSKLIEGKGTAIFSIIGFASVMFTYLGVSFLLPGLHSYMNV